MRVPKIPVLITMVCVLALVLGGAQAAHAAPAPYVTETTTPVGTGPTGVAYDPVTDRVFVANTAAGSVTILDAQTSQPIGPDVLVGAAPVDVAIDSARSRAYVSSSATDSLWMIDTTTGAVVGAPIAVPKSPNSLAINRVSDRLFVTSPGTGAISVSMIDLATQTVVGAPIPLAGAPMSIAVSEASNRVYVADAINPRLFVLDATTGTQIGLPIPLGVSSAGGLAVDPVHNRLFATLTATSQVAMFDAATAMPVGALIPVSTTPIGVSINAAQNRAYVALPANDTIAVIDTVTGTLIDGAVGVGDGPRQIAVKPSTDRVFVTNQTAGTLTTLAPAQSPTITRADAPAGVVGVPYSASFRASGVPVPALTLTGTIPPGLAFDPATGDLSGTPILAGTYVLTFSASNGVSPDASTQVSVVIASPGGNIPSGGGGVDPNCQLAVTGDGSSWWALGALLTGLALIIGGLVLWRRNSRSLPAA